MSTGLKQNLWVYLRYVGKIEIRHKVNNRLCLRVQPTDVQDLKQMQPNTAASRQIDISGKKITMEKDKYLVSVVVISTSLSLRSTHGDIFRYEKLQPVTSHMRGFSNVLKSLNISRVLIIWQVLQKEHRML